MNKNKIVAGQDVAVASIILEPDIALSLPVGELDAMRLNIRELSAAVAKTSLPPEAEPATYLRALMPKSERIDR